MSVRVGIVVFPGSTDDRDAARAARLMGAEAVMLAHRDASLGGVDAVVVPGGFSYGDYLRAGALAARSPVMEAVRTHAAAGRPVLGICNGFQVLTEAGLLPGALRPNTHLEFRSQDVGLRVERESPWLPGASAGDVLELPVKHHDGCFYAAARTLAALERDGRVLLRYTENPNGSVDDVACVTNPAGNVAGLMPHPEHAVEELLGSTDGRVLLQGLLDLAGARATVVT